MIVELRTIDVRRGGRLIVEDISAVLDAGRMVGLVGPNGSGKSTLLQTVYRVLSAERGAVLIDDREISTMSLAESSRVVAVVTQDSPADLDLTVYEAVMLGRLPHQRASARESVLDHEHVWWALDAVGIASLAEREWATLSGGERQRALVARALAQDCPVLILDEPTNHLDVHHQLSVLQLARSLGRTTVAALHDLNLAAQYCDYVLVLDAGRIVASGTPDEVFVEDVLAPVFRVQVDRVSHPRTGTTQILFSPIRSTSGPTLPEGTSCIDDSSPC